MSWSKVVWIEGNIEYEDTIPSSWLIEEKDGRFLMWPREGKNAKKMMEKKIQPSEDWLKFKVKKVKLSNGEMSFSLARFQSKESITKQWKSESFAISPMKRFFEYLSSMQTYDRKFIGHSCHFWMFFALFTENYL